jgi:hypothetical protein
MNLLQAKIRVREQRRIMRRLALVWKASRQQDFVMAESCLFGAISRRNRAAYLQRQIDSFLERNPCLPALLTKG